MTSFSFFKYFDAFELDVNVVNFVYYGKTRMHSNGTLSFDVPPDAPLDARCGLKSHSIDVAD